MKDPEPDPFRKFTTKHASTVGILFLLLLAAGCAWSGRSLATAANNPAAVERDPDGAVMMRSEQKHLVSVLSRSGKFSNDSFTLPSFHVIVTNGGEKPLTLKPGDISAYSGNRRVALLDPIALQDRLDREQANERVGFAAGMRDASQPAEVRQGHPHHPSPTRPAVEPFSAPKFKVPAQIVEQALKSQVIAPFEVGGGRIMLEAQDIQSGQPLKIVVNVAGEKHEFLLEVR